MRTSMAFTSHTLYKRIALFAVLVEILIIGTVGCRYSTPSVIHTFEKELQSKYTYIKSFSLNSETPRNVLWICRLSENRAVADISDLIDELKEFALDDSTFKALDDTGYFTTKESLDDVMIWIRFGKNDSERIYSVYCRPSKDDYTWQYWQSYY